MDVFIGSSH